MDARKQYIREAYHAGSWYENDPAQLNSTLTDYLSIAQNANDATQTATQTAASSSAAQGLPRGVIAPHAGFRFSGPTAAYAYLALGEAMQKSWSGTVIVLHPSHHVYLDGCAISGATSLETPLGNIPVDEALRTELLGTGEFTIMSKETDQKEHSGEMQYPFIQKALLDSKESNSSSNSDDNDDGDDEEGATASAQSQSQSLRIRILPIMIGAVSTCQEQHFGKLLAPFLARENNFAVISSDFCHWGRRFGYTPTSPPDHIQAPNFVKDIHEYIEWMDHVGMDNIASQEPGAFAKYIKLYKNTICGRHPIAVYLCALKENQEAGREEVDLSFVKYAQSTQVKNLNDSSVSYASAVARRKL